MLLLLLLALCHMVMVSTTRTVSRYQFLFGAGGSLLLVRGCDPQHAVPSRASPSRRGRPWLDEWFLLRRVSRLRTCLLEE